MPWRMSSMARSRKTERLANRASPGETVQWGISQGSGLNLAPLWASVDGAIHNRRGAVDLRWHSHEIYLLPPWTSLARRPI
jgi:hypothetical protein